MKSKKLSGNKPGSSTQKYLDIAEVRDNLVLLNDGTVRGVLLVSSINFDLKSEDEQRAIIGGYISFLNTLDYPLQIVIQSRPLNIDDYMDRIKKVEKERKDMLDRLMSRNLVEFKDNVKPEDNDYGEDSTEVEILDVNNDDIEKING